MGKSIKLRLGRVARGERGFTLIEMLVVVGIIVALAAIIVPLVIAFSGEGEKASREGERETIQTAIQSMMVKHDLAKVKAYAGAATAKGQQITNTGTDFQVASSDTYTLKDFIDQGTTKYCYKWDDKGRITHQYDDDGTSPAVCATEFYASP